MTIKSITLGELGKKIMIHLQEHPEDESKPVYHDCLHIDGRFEVEDEIIELY